MFVGLESLDYVTLYGKYSIEMSGFPYEFIVRYAQCLKITEKVSFNIVSETNYVYILSGQKFIKNAPKMVHFSEFLKT